MNWEVDEVGVDKMEVNDMESRQSGNKPFSFVAVALILSLQLN